MASVDCYGDALLRRDNAPLSLLLSFIAKSCYDYVCVTSLIEAGRTTAGRSFALYSAEDTRTVEYGHTIHPGRLLVWACALQCSIHSLTHSHLSPDSVFFITTPGAANTTGFSTFLP